MISANLALIIRLSYGFIGWHYGRALNTQWVAVAGWLTSYERVLARHQSSSICLMEFALGTPKLVERWTLFTLATAWFPGLKKSQVCVNIYMLWPTPFLSLVALHLCLSLPASLLLQLLYHGFAGLHGRGLRQSLSPHQLFAPLRLPPLHSSHAAAAASSTRRSVVLAIKHTGAATRTAQVHLWRCADYTFCVITVLMLYNPPAHFFACVRGRGGRRSRRGEAVWFWLDCPSWNAKRSMLF